MPQIIPIKDLNNTVKISEKIFRDLKISEKNVAEGKVKDAVSSLSDIRAKYNL